VQLHLIVKEALRLLRSTLPTTIDIQTDIDPQCPAVLADPTQIHQILMNLCANAQHAMESFGGVLKVELKTTHVERGKLHITPGEYVELLVSDNGCGIGPDVMSKIFDPYFTTKEIGKGTGMGLAIIHGIVAEYGGGITVDSKLGEGTTFHVYFPVAKQLEVPLDKGRSEKTLGGEGQILFVDDEEIIVEMSKDILERLGYTVTVRQNSLDALTTFQNSPQDFDVVITDQTMPGMTGIDLARRMLQIRPDIPIILCTGHSNLVDEPTAKAQGIREFALKPLTQSTISSLIQKVMRA